MATAPEGGPLSSGHRRGKHQNPTVSLKLRTHGAAPQGLSRRSRAGSWHASGWLRVSWGLIRGFLIRCCLVPPQGWHRAPRAGLCSCTGPRCSHRDAGDVGAGQWAAVQLVRIKAARRQEVATGFGAPPGRCGVGSRQLSLVDLAGRRRCGPKGGTKLAGEVVGQIRRLEAAGQTLDGDGCGDRAIHVQRP